MQGEASGEIMSSREEQAAPDDAAAATEDAAAPDDGGAAERAARFGTLPGRVDPGDMVEENPADPPNDPEFGRNPDNDWMVRYSA